jgi:hypothetical protein
MKNLLPVIFASIAAIGNAMFALGQKKSTGVENGLLFVGLSAVVAVLFVFLFAPYHHNNPGWYFLVERASQCIS